MRSKFPAIDLTITFLRSAGKPVAYLLFALVIILNSACGLVGGLFYNDWRSDVAYRSSKSKRDYYIIKGITQSHCGCSDLVVKGYADKKPSFTFYYGGGLFPAKKYVFQRNDLSGKIDTLVFRPVTTGIFSTPLDSLDKEILLRIDSLIVRPNSDIGLVYPVKKSTYTGFVREK